MAKRIVVTDEEGRARLVREMEALKYHMGAMDKHGKLATTIAKEYMLLTTTGLGSWRRRWGGNAHKWAMENIEFLLGNDVSNPTSWNFQHQLRRRALLLGRAKQAIRREKMK